MLQPVKLDAYYGGPSEPKFPSSFAGPLPADLMDLQLWAQGGHPHAAYAAMRRAAPVMWHPTRDAYEGGFWAVTAHALVREVSMNPGVYSSQKGGINIGYGAPELRHPRLFPAVIDTMICLDAPDHLTLRKEHMPFFTAGYVAELKARVDAKVTALLDAMEAALRGRAERLPETAKLPAGQIDMVEYFSAELPLYTLCEILGVPAADRPKLVDWMHYLEVAQDTLSRYRATGEMSPADIEFIGRFFGKIEEMFAYGADILQKRRDEPQKDLLSAIARMRVEGELLPPSFLDGSWLLIVFAGNDTTRNTLSGTMKLLTEFPEEKQKLLAKPELIGTMVDEAIRLVTPVIHMRRTVTEDTTLGGQRLGAGEKVVMWYGAANRDPEVFPDPDRFDVTRENAGAHLAFGIGAHVCLGQRVAQMQLASAYQQLLARFPGARYAGGMDLAPNNFTLSIRRLPVGGL